MSGMARNEGAVEPRTAAAVHRLAGERGSEPMMGRSAIGNGEQVLG